jgi:hypothetical protein
VIIRIETGLAATQLDLATKAEFGDKPSQRWPLWAVMAAAFTAAIVAGAMSAMLFTLLRHH